MKGLVLLVVLGTSVHLSQGAAWYEVSGGPAGGNLGWDVAFAGDVNGDGLPDYIVGAPYDGTGGAAYVVFGRGTFSTLTTDLSTYATSNEGFKIVGSISGGNFGRTVSGAGDVNGDGKADLIVGAPYTNSNTGTVYVIFGKATSTTVNVGSLGTQGFEITGDPSLSYLGASVSGVGDVTGDGLADVAMGAPQPTTAPAKVYVVFGSASRSGNGAISLSSLGSDGFYISGGVLGDEAGTGVSGGEDYNNDGWPDIIVGAPTIGAGKVYVVYGRGSSSTTYVDLSSLGGAGFIITGAASSDNTGKAVSTAGDVNGDSIADLVIGAFGVSGNTGAAYVVFGRSSPVAVNLGSLGAAGFKVAGYVSSGYVGNDVSAAGDVNNDGKKDILVSSFLLNSLAGASYVIFGRTATTTVDLSTMAGLNQGFAINGAVAGDYVGISASAAGDQDGDGKSDLLVGAPNVRFNYGAAYVVYGQTASTSVDLQVTASRTPSPSRTCSVTPSASVTPSTSVSPSATSSLSVSSSPSDSSSVTPSVSDSSSASASVTPTPMSLSSSPLFVIDAAAISAEPPALRDWKDDFLRIGLSVGLGVPICVLIFLAIVLRLKDCRAPKHYRFPPKRPRPDLEELPESSLSDESDVLDEERKSASPAASDESMAAA